MGAEVRVTVDDAKVSKKGATLTLADIDAGVHSGSSQLDKDIHRRLKAADTNADGTLSQEEIVGLVKDLVIEHRTTQRTRLVAAATFFLLLISCFGNFALMVWGNELTKESHVAPGGETATPVGGLDDEEVASSPSRMARLLQQGYRGPAAAIAAANKKKASPSMTTTDGKTIVSTKEAMMAMPMSVTTVMDKADLEKAKEITFEVADLDQEGVETSKYASSFDKFGRSLWGAAAKEKMAAATQGGANRVKTKTMKVKSVEQLSPTHAKFLGEEGEEIEVKDGAIIAKEYVPMSKLLNNPSLRGDAIDAKESITAASEAKLKNGAKIPVKPDNLEARTAKVSQPVCGSSISIPAKDTDEKADVDALRMKMVEELDKRGVDVSDIKDRVLKRRQRRLQTGGDPNAPYAGADLLPDPAVFADGCASPVKTVLGPTLASVADEQKKVNAEKQAKGADREAMAEKMQAKMKAMGAGNGADAEAAEEPERFACTDSTLGCKPLKIEVDADTKLADLIAGMKKRQGGARRNLADVPKRIDELYISERIGGEGGSNEEIYLADEGICGLKTMGKEEADGSTNIGAVAFKPCKEGAEFSKPLGVKGRANELATQANEPERKKKSAFSVAAAEEAEDAAAARKQMELREAEEEEAQAKARGASDAQAQEAALMKRFQQTKRKFDGTEGLNRAWTDEGELPLTGFKAKQGDVVDSLKFTRNLKYDEDYLGESKDGADADATDQFAKFYAANPEMGAKIKEAAAGTGEPFPPKRKVPNRGGRRRLNDGNVTEVEPVATLGTRLVGAIVKSDGHLKSISFIYKDDCAEMIEDLEKYEQCKDRVKQAHCNLRDPNLPANPLTNKCTYGASEAGLKAAARRR